MHRLIGAVFVSLLAPMLAGASNFTKGTEGGAVPGGDEARELRLASRGVSGGTGRGRHQSARPAAVRLSERCPHRTVDRQHGQEGKTTPTGVFTILQRKVDHESSIYKGAKMPHMQRLTWDGIAIHAGRLPGYPASAGVRACSGGIC
jgi:hypothetical protein